MRTLIVGGGKVGSYLARKLAGDGHVVTLIESDNDHAVRIARGGGVIVFEGDGTDVDLLKRADVHRSDWVFAVTGSDDVNLVASQLSLTLGAKKVLARLNDPVNSPTYEALGLNTVAVTDLMVDVIERDLRVHDMGSNTLLVHGKLSVSEFEVGSTFLEAVVQSLDLPESSLLVAIERGSEVIIPHGQTVIRPNDRLVVASSITSLSDIHELFCVGER